MRQRDSSVQAILAVAAGAALLGLAPVGLRLSELGPQATALWRFVFAVPALLALAAFSAPAARRAGLSAWPALAAAGVCFGLDIAFWHAALTFTTVANATLFSNMTPILTVGAAAFFFKEPIRRAFLTGAPIALAGAALLSLARSQQGLGADGLRGDGLALFSAVWYAAYLLIVSRARRTADAWTIMALTTLAAALCALAASLVMGEQMIPETPRGWAILVGLGLIVHVGGQGLIAVGLGRLPIGLSTMLLWVQPIAAAGFGWALFEEPLGALAFLGAGLILLGVFIVQRDRDQAGPQRPKK